MSVKKEKVQCHLSVDDTYNAFKELCDEKYVSIWQHPFWHNLRKIHKKWGCSFTLYVFNGLENLPDLSNKERMIRELRECSTWVKVAYHGHDEADLTEFKKNFYAAKQFLTHLFGEDGIAHIIRLHRFYATYDTVDYLKSEGVSCLLAADDDRLSYDLCEEQAQKLQNKGILKDNSMTYLHTDIRLEKRHCLTQYCNWEKRGTNIFVIFTHERFIMGRISLVMLKLRLLLRIIHIKYDVSYLCY